MPGNVNNAIDNYLHSLPMFSIVSVRQIFIIKLDHLEERYVAVIEIGLTEVSSCNPTVVEGQHINKGDELGYFQFGGSSYVVIFDKALEL